MYWCDLVCIYAGGDVPVTPLHSNLVSGKTGAADRRHSHGIASPHRSTLKVKNCDKKTTNKHNIPPWDFCEAQPDFDCNPGGGKLNMNLGAKFPIVCKEGRGRWRVIG